MSRLAWVGSEGSVDNETKIWGGDWASAAPSGVPAPGGSNKMTRSRSSPLPPSTTPSPSPGDTVVNVKSEPSEWTPSPTSSNFSQPTIRQKRQYKIFDYAHGRLPMRRMLPPVPAPPKWIWGSTDEILEDMEQEELKEELESDDSDEPDEENADDDKGDNGFAVEVDASNQEAKILDYSHGSYNKKYLVNPCYTRKRDKDFVSGDPRQLPPVLAKKEEQTDETKTSEETI